MKNIWIRISENKNYRTKFIWSVVALSVIVVMTLPVCVAASMSFYKADDFIECISDIDRNFRELLLFSLNCSKDAYFHWMGTYFSKFVQTLFHPLNGGGLMQLRIVMTTNALLFVASLCIFVYTLSKSEIRSSAAGLLLSACCCAVFFGFQTWQEALYWYSGAMCFSLPLSIFFLGLTIVLRLDDYQKKWLIIASGILLFCGSGGSLAVAGTGCWFLFMIVVAKSLHKNLKKSHIFLFIVAVLGAAINALAPGNFVRHGVIDDSGVHLFRAVIWSFSFVLENIQWLFTETPFLVIFILSFLIGAYEGKKGQIDKRYAGIMIIMNAIAPLVTCFPVCLGYSADGGGNRCQFVIICTLVISSVSIAVLAGKLMTKHVTENLTGNAVLAMLILIVVMPAEADGWKVTSLIPLKTMVELADGDIQEYYRDVNRVYDAISADSNENVFLHEGLKPADTFWEADLAEDPNCYMNITCASYYQKESVQYVTQPVYHSGDITYVRIETSGFHEDLSYVSIINNGASGTENIQILEPLTENMVLQIPGEETGKVEIYVFDDATGKVCLEQREIEY